MIKWFKKNQDVSTKNSPPVPETDTNQPQREAVTIETPETALAAEQPLPEVQPQEESRLSFYTRLKRGLAKTRQQFGDSVGRLLLGKKQIDAGLLEELETVLISADLGIDTSQEVLKQLSEGMARKQLNDGDAVFRSLKDKLESILSPCSQPLLVDNQAHKPFVILAVGVNGAGKTTTIGKLAKQFQQQGKKVMLAAGDTFRAAAVQQLQVWGARNEIPVIAQHTGADSASVIYDALQAATARGIDILIADTAGRLHTQNNLMEELKKVKRVMQKINPEAPHETMLVLDASIGQNALNQAREFHQAVGLSGITMTKLDGTARGGILFAIANELAIPFRYLGVGEGIDDLRPFEPSQFVKALFNDN
ncbi:signal recognition particle-docking protein FtsY [Legionella sp. 16cNR16C]|uniref:signal recognition particle-docking protein FtsY n=1 Tax=Legionella sp. 16cNR16C TaxID=2905656 RepID=UPI001E3FDE50|nr:signal recognition particle-docking protein FtsY [Legionella sp. 16cNR16C]MCE3043636.1 signal recognition particle-docking protein FtsY [Legionella sp. 16cNR16C]